MISDELGRTIDLTRPPQRIVSLVPSLSEWLFHVGVGDRLVGVTDFCIEPAAELAQLPRIRGTKNPDRERIIALEPDLVLAEKEENRERDVMALCAAGIQVYVTDIRRVADAPAQLTRLAAVLDAPAAAEPLGELRSAVEAAERRLQRKRTALAFIWRDPWMAIGNDTYAGDLMRLCGLQNLAAHLPGRYPRAELAGFMDLNPDLILLPSEPYAFSEHDMVAFADFPTTTAVHNNAIHLCDGTLLTWPGMRTIKALRVFSQL
jgi:ABC-type Fe3+-hydroxamate transport system substrate-binding protein